MGLRAARPYRLALACIFALALGACQLAGARGPADLPLHRLTLPPGFAIEVWAVVPGARSLALSDDGRRVYVGTAESSVFAVLDHERDGVADAVVEVAHGLAAPAGVTVDGGGALLIVERHRILRIAPHNGRAEVVVPAGVLPDGAGPDWRSAAVGPDGRLYVPVGAGCTGCASAAFAGTIVRLRPDGHDLQIFARGVRGPAGLDWHPASHELFFTDAGGDQAGALKRALEDGSPAGVATFGSGAGALGIDFYDGSMFPAEYRHDAFVAEQGAQSPGLAGAPRIVRVRFARGRAAGSETFVAGWLGRDGRAWGRPVDLEELPDGSLLVADGLAGVIYRITYDPAPPRRR